MVLAMCDKYGYEEQHCQRVAGLAGQLFALLADLHGMGEEAAALLRHGALLHDIGHAVHYRAHHRHGAYLIEHDASLAGYPAQERAVLAYLARAHRKQTVPPPPAGGGTGRRALRLAALLRLADGLDHERTGKVQILGAEVTGKRITLTVEGVDLVAQADLLNRKAALMKPAFGRKVVWQAGAGATP
ncbi:MAG: hypothetical protein K0R39_1444 [Symbiobacteriaceae bacterium]|jgi:exopolyphosphatase/guanosine-5'-triphosphate,3'-diphosphate pyrophosphatase|nr:hypothetical protein [Symbiobacteriaceae bacterium]